MQKFLCGRCLYTSKYVARVLCHIHAPNTGNQDAQKCCWTRSGGHDSHSSIRRVLPHYWRYLNFHLCRYDVRLQKTVRVEMVLLELGLYGSAVGTWVICPFVLPTVHNEHSSSNLSKPCIVTRQRGQSSVNTVFAHLSTWNVRWTPAHGFLRTGVNLAWTSSSSLGGGLSIAHQTATMSCNSIASFPNNCITSLVCSKKALVK